MPYTWKTNNKRDCKSLLSKYMRRSTSNRDHHRGWPNPQCIATLNWIPTISRCPTPDVGIESIKAIGSVLIQANRRHKRYLALLKRFSRSLHIYEISFSRNFPGADGEKKRATVVGKSFADIRVGRGGGRKNKIKHTRTACATRWDAPGGPELSGPLLNFSSRLLAPRTPLVISPASRARIFENSLPTRPLQRR